MFKSFFITAKWALWAYGGLFLLLFFLYIQTSLNVAINEWYKDFYDILQKPKIQSKAEQKARQDDESKGQILSQDEFLNAVKALNLELLNDDNQSLNFALIYAKAKEFATQNSAQMQNSAQTQSATKAQNSAPKEQSQAQNSATHEKSSNLNATNSVQANQNLNFQTLATQKGINLDIFIDTAKHYAATKAAQEKLDGANFLNKFSLYFYQSLLEHFFNARSISGENAYSIGIFYAMIWVFLCIALPYVLIATINVYFASIYALKWREAMTFEYLAFWKAKDDNIEGSSQRIQEDIYNFSKIVESLGLAFIRALMILFAFIPILWALSGVIAAPLFEGIDENSIFAPLKHIDGLLVYVALFISLGGLFISWFVGIKLPGLEYNNQKAEAAFRKELVFAEDNRRDYATRETMIELFTGLKFNYKRLFLHYGYFNIWLILFEQIIVIVPFLIVAPSLFAGAIGLGVVMQMNNAFDQVRSSFSVFITNWTKITELRSIHKRLREFEENIEYRKSLKR